MCGLLLTTRFVIVFAKVKITFRPHSARCGLSPNEAVRRGDQEFTGVRLARFGKGTMPALLELNTKHANISTPIHNSDASILKHPEPRISVLRYRRISVRDRSAHPQRLQET